MCATSVIDADELDRLPLLKERREALVSRNPGLTRNLACPAAPGSKGRRLLASTRPEEIIEKGMQAATGIIAEVSRAE